jgi:hypothetical protein
MKKLNIISVTVLIVFLSGVTQITAQEIETLLNPGSDFKFVWGTEFKTSSIKGNLGTSHGFFGGALLNHSTLLGISFGVNLTHQKLNHGYLGLLVQHTHKPNDLIHFSGQLLLATASAKGYNQQKTNLFDNLGNITGSGFYIIEPGLNVELNLTGQTVLIFGVSYRFATGLGDLSFEQWDKKHENFTRYTYNDNDLSSLQFNIGLKFGEF